MRVEAIFLSKSQRLTHAGVTSRSAANSFTRSSDLAFSMLSPPFGGQIIADLRIDAHHSRRQICAFKSGSNQVRVRTGEESSISVAEGLGGERCGRQARFRALFSQFGSHRLNKTPVLQAPSLVRLL